MKRRILEQSGILQINVPAGVDPCAFADDQALRGVPWAVTRYEEIARGIGEVWGSRLNLCPPVEKIVYMGTFAEKVMRIPFFVKIVRDTILRRSMFRDQHEKIPIVRAQALHGPLYGAARIFCRNVSG